MSSDLRYFLTQTMNYFTNEGIDNPNLGDARSIVAKQRNFPTIEGELICLIVAHGQFKPIRAILGT